MASKRTVAIRPPAVQPENRLRLSGEGAEASAILQAARLARDLKHALHRTIHQSTQPAKAIAAAAGISYHFLANAALESTQDQLPFPRLPLVLAACDDLTLLQFLADRQGALVTRRPVARVHRADVRQTAAALREFASFIDAAADADADGVIDPHELARLDSTGRALLEVIAQVLADYRARVTRPLLDRQA